VDASASAHASNIDDDRPTTRSPEQHLDSQIGNESVPIQLAQCRFRGLAISDVKILIYFSNKIYGSNFISTPKLLWFETTKKIIVSFVIIFGTFSFPISILK